MKKLRPAIALLALLSFAGGGVAMKWRADVNAKRGADRSSAPADGDRGTTSPTKRPRAEFGDKERVAKIRNWLAMTKDDPEAKFSKEIYAVIEGLSLEAVQELLADRDGLADEITGYIDDTFPIHGYPLRFEIRLLLWQRYGTLAPEEALSLAFPEGKPAKDHSIQIEDILFGVAKSDPRRAFEVWRTHYSESDGLTFMTRMPVDSAAWELAAECTKQSPETVRAQLGEMGVAVRRDAYRGYASTLGENTDWAAEVARLEALFPDPAERRFTSQHPTCSLITSWAKSDPAAAFAWMKSLEKENDPGLTQMGYREVIAGWMSEQPATSLEFLKQWNPPVANEDRFYAGILTGYGSDDPAIAVGVLELIQEPAQREAVARKLIEGNSTSSEVLRSLETSKRLPDHIRQEAATALLAKGK